MCGQALDACCALTAVERGCRKQLSMQVVMQVPRRAPMHNVCRAKPTVVFLAVFMLLPR